MENKEEKFVSKMRKKETTLPVVGSGGRWKYEDKDSKEFKLMEVSSVYILIGQLYLWGYYEIPTKLMLEGSQTVYLLVRGKVYCYIEKPDPDSEEWRKLAINLAINYCPTIFPCIQCGYPVIDGYCCGFCGSSTPGEPDENGL